MRLVRVVDELLDIFERGEDFRAFHLDGQAIVLEDYLEVRPQNETRLRRQIEAGRILCGPWYILPDEFLVSGEAHIRNLIAGQQVMGRFGPSMWLGYLPDLFGHISQMPQLLVDAGMDTAILWRGLTGEREGLKSELLWEAPDGSRVLAIHLPEESGYSNANNLPLEPDAAYKRLRHLREDRALVAATPHLLLMNGVDHHGPQRRLPGLLRALNERFTPEGARLVHDTLPEYVDAVRRAVDEGGGDAALQVRRGELREVNRSGTTYSNFLLYGVASARMYVKQANHRAQQALERHAEPWAAVAWLLGAPYPQGYLTQSWKYLLQNHPHDSICGCSLDEVHEQMMTRFQWSTEIADQVAAEALHQVSARAATPALGDGEVALRLFNSLPWERREAVEATAHFPPNSAARGFLVLDDAGSVLPSTVRGDRVAVRTVDHSAVQPAPRNVASREVKLAFLATVPATGFSTYRVRALPLPAWDRPGPAPSDVRVGPVWLENEHLRIEAASNGTVSVFHKLSGRRFDGLLGLEDGGDVGDEYTYSAPQRDRVVTSHGCAAAISLVEAGPVTGRLRIDLDLPVPEAAAPDRRARSDHATSLRVSTWLTLAAGARRLECETVVDNVARDHRLRVLFPTAIEAASHHVDQAFDVVERPNDYAQPPAAHWSEDAPATHPQRLFVDLADAAGGIAVLNQGLAEYGITGVPGGPRGIAVTLLRCVQYLGAAAFPSTIRGGAGPHKETPGAQCQGRHTFRYAIVPHAGTWAEAGLQREALAYASPCLVHAVADDLPGAVVPPVSESVGVPARRLQRSESFLQVDGDSIVLSALKRAEAPDQFEAGDPDGLLVVRVYNPSWHSALARVRLWGGIERAWRGSILETRGDELPLHGDTVSLTLEPKKIVTVLLQSPLRAAGDVADQA
jgi:alpha-mannosidase